MKKRIMLALALMLTAVATLSAKNALIIVAHGSPMESWQKPVLDLEPLVKKQLAMGKLKGIDIVKVALMEYTEPSVASVVKVCEAEGADTIFALPVFMAPSSHTEEDLPNILGHKYNPYVLEELAEEQTELVHTKTPIILGPTFYYSYLLEESMLNRVQNLSKDASNEAVIYLTHGDPERDGFWKEVLKNVDKYTKEHTEIDYVDHAVIEMGHDFANELMPLLSKASQKKKRIIVQGIYLVSDVKRMADRHKMTEVQSDLVKKTGVEIVYSADGILPACTPLVVDWIVAQTNKWLESKR